MTRPTLLAGLAVAALAACTVPAPATDDTGDTAGGAAGQAAAGAAGHAGGAATGGSAGATSGQGGASAAGSSGAAAGKGGSEAGSAGATTGGAAGDAGGGAGGGAANGGAGAGGAGSGGAGSGGAGSGGTSGGGAGSGGAGSGGVGGSALGDTCADPVIIPAAPFVVDASTIGHANDYGVDAAMCAGVATAQGHASPDVVYRFSPSETGLYDVIVEPSKIPTLYDPLLYVATTCPATTVSCLGASDEVPSVSTGGKEVLTLSLTAGQTYFVFVDGTYDKNATAEGAQGNYELRITKKP